MASTRASSDVTNNRDLDLNPLKMSKNANASLDLKNIDIQHSKTVGFTKIKFLTKKLEHFSQIVQTIV